MAAGLAAAATVGARAEPEAISVSVKDTVYIMYNAFRAQFFTCANTNGGSVADITCPNAH